MIGRVIKGQVVASTALDRHGEQLTREELRELFGQMPNERAVNLNHDPREPPVARVFNSYLNELPGGILAIKSDLEVFDEDRFAEVRGMSISYHRGQAAGSAPTETPRVLISFNPREIGTRAPRGRARIVRAARRGCGAARTI